MCNHAMDKHPIRGYEVVEVFLVYATKTGINANLLGHLAHLRDIRGCFLPWPLLERMLV